MNTTGNRQARVTLPRSTISNATPLKEDNAKKLAIELTRTDSDGWRYEAIEYYSYFVVEVSDSEGVLGYL